MKTALLVLSVLAILLYVWIQYLRHTPYGRLTTRSALVAWRYGDRPVTSVENQRENMAASRKMINRNKVQVDEVRDFTISGPGGSIPVRLYHPGNGQSLPLILYAHGGGWVGGDLESHDNICRRLAAVTKMAVLAVDYRLSPEAVFPAALEDYFAVLKWAVQHGSTIGADSSRIALAGDSAGGNLAAALSLKVRDELPGLIKAQVLIYPVINVASFDTPSYENFAKGYWLSRELMDFFRRAYATENQWTDPFCSPGLAPDLSKLPPAMIITAQFDPLRDEGEAYGDKLRQAGVPVSVVRYEGVLHGFFGHNLMGREGIEAVEAVANFLRKKL